MDDCRLAVSSCVVQFSMTYKYHQTFSLSIPRASLSLSVFGVPRPLAELFSTPREESTVELAFYHTLRERDDSREEVFSSILGLLVKILAPEALPDEGELWTSGVGDKGKEKGMEQKQSPYSVDESYLISLTTKRHKANFSISAKDRKEKLGKRIVALQQLVSPYGKTDTASVLLEAMEYIQFLHEQIKVLITPYLESTPMPRIQDDEPWSLGSNGLCLVPISSTTRIARCNGADIWAPIKTSSSKLENVSQLQ